MKAFWSRIGGAVGRLWVAVALTVVAALLLVVQGDFLKHHMRIKVEASDLLPKDHPKNTEFEFIRHTFQGSSRGFFIAVDAPVTRLRAVIPEVARAAQALPDVSFIRWRVERDYFEDHLPLFQSLADLRSQAAYLGEYHGDVKRLVEHSGSLADFLIALADIIDGEQELSAPTNEAAKDAKLAKDVQSLTPFFTTLRRATGELAGGREVDPRFVDRGIEDLLLRGWFDPKDMGRLDRELLIPEDVWDKDGPTTALVWVATGRSDVDPEFSTAFMQKAEAIRAELRARFPDCVFRFTGGIASYNTYAQTVMTDFDKANVLGLVSVLILLVVGFRSFAPFVLLMLFLFEGTLGTLVLQNLLFDGVNMIATAGALAIIGIGSDYGVIFLLAYQHETAAAVRDRQAGKLLRKQYLRAVRNAIKRALGTIGTSTTVGCLVSAASFIALGGADVIPAVQKLLGLPMGPPKGFQPIRELGVGGAVGLLDCLLMMLVFLPASLYLLEWGRTHPIVERIGRLFRPLERRLGRSKRWLVLAGRLRLFMRTEHERRWFRALGSASVRRRGWVVGGAVLIFIAAVAAGTRIEWSTGQKEVEPRHSEAVDVSERVERTFGKSFENLLVYGPLDVVRKFHTRVKKLVDAPGTNLGEVTSIDDYLPSMGEAQEDKLALVKQVDAALAGIRPALPPTALVLTHAEEQALVTRLGRVIAGLEGLHVDGAAPAQAIAAARANAGLVALALLGARPLDPAAEWSAELGALDPAALQALADGCRATADKWLEEQVAQARISELKRLAGGIEALGKLGGGVVPRRDLAALGLALGQLGLTEPAAQLAAASVGPAPAEAVVAWLPRADLLDEDLALAKFAADSGAIGLKVKEGAAFADRVAELEEITDFLALRARPSAAEAGRESERLLGATYRLRRSLDSLASFAAASGFAHVAPEMPAANAALDGLIAQLADLAPQRADGVARELDQLFSERLFDRFETVKRAAARVRQPLGLADVPASALQIFSGQADGQTLYLARVLPRVSMLERQPFQEIHQAVEQALHDVAPPQSRSGFSGFEVLLNLATDFLESTFSGAMVAVTFFVLLALSLLHRSVLATLLVAAPVVFGTALTLAMMALAHLRITVFTVVALPIVIGVGCDSSIQVFRVYWDELSERGRVTLPDVMAEVGKVVALNALSTVLPFGMMMLGDMKGLVALGTILAFGCLACFAAKLTLLPALISIVHEYVVPAELFSSQIYPKNRGVRLLRMLLGRWREMVPPPDAGITPESQSDGLVIFTGRRPPLNLMDGALCCKGVELTRAFLRDPDARAVICRSGLPQHYLVEDPSGRVLLDGRGKPKRIAAAVAESDALPAGYKLVGPVRPFGGGADLAAMSQRPIDALFMFRAGIEYATTLWYAQKPIIYIAEGDTVAGWFELGMCCNYFVVTKHARLGAPEVKRGLTLPMGAHALLFRSGSAVAANLMATGELVSGEEAVRLGIADALVPDGEDATEWVAKLCQSREFLDKIRQVSLLRQYGPNMRQLVTKSFTNYVKLLRDPDTRKRLREYLHNDT
jgi:predicted RND superfamily exporter protein/enoyl-CoA hydratase/carnithine racemase